VIVELGFADRETVDGAVEEERRRGRRVGRNLVDRGELTEAQLGIAIAERYGLDYLDLGEFDVDMTAANLITAATAKRYKAVPVGFVDEETLLLAISDPTDGFALNDISVMVRLQVQAAVASQSEILALIEQLPKAKQGVQRAEQPRADGVGDEVPTQPSREQATSRSFTAATTEQAMDALRVAIAAELSEDARTALAELAALRERLEHLERELSELRQGRDNPGVQAG
jgi:type IV pilus assembly protein PilB